MIDNDQTRGLSQRELLLEVRQDIKDIKMDMGKRPLRSEIYGALGGVSVLLIILSRFV